MIFFADVFLNPETGTFLKLQSMRFPTHTKIELMCTVFLIFLYTPSFLLEIRVDIKIWSHPWYPLICDLYKWNEGKKENQNGRLKKNNEFSTNTKN